MDIGFQNQISLFHLSPMLIFAMLCPFSNFPFRISSRSCSGIVSPSWFLLKLTTSEGLLLRMMSYYIGSSLQLDGRIWADKYQSKRAIEVCGNEESVKFLSEWLRLWRERDHKPSKNSIGGDESDIEDTYDDWYPSDTDSGNIDGPRLKNLLLVTGPVGGTQLGSSDPKGCFIAKEDNGDSCRGHIGCSMRTGLSVLLAVPARN
ncbi:uncharacterized protein LOC119998458 isoform X2 [Tripterygium wilfordii]|uniref:uncharacterized protein LOC119998458 isoform X2 n=1 Tax=Tripterygium wilfordii TaxID=458696 RepID=UPI0018F80A9E|nr:uncharacterized protein LOC119998458 isoform X2 [Tripterygium wilfordii]XP_038701725.1 uncharacterized protein LOC119998458 isoform X2 [Tripterygium wilfordii]